MAKNDPHEDEIIIAFTNAFHLALWDTFTGFTSRWRKYDENKQDDITSRAIVSLNNAGLIEIRLGVMVRWIGYPYLLQAVFEVCGENTESEVDRQVAELAEGAPGWVEDDASQAQARIDVFTMAVRQSARGISLSPPHFSAKDLLDTLGRLNEGILPDAPAVVNIVDFQPWTPSKLQLRIWNALDGWALTTDKLEKIAARSTLFKKPGGLPEMLELGLIANDRQTGGYYRPDSSPKI